MANILQDPKVMAAITSIIQRSERQNNEQRLQASYVDLGIKSSLESVNNHIVYGRRGTGKTHLLKVLQDSSYFKERRTCQVYIDARTLGSTEQFSDETISLDQRCFSLFQYIMILIWGHLQNHYFRNEDLMAKPELEQYLGELGAIITKPYIRHEHKKRNRKTKQSDMDENAIAFDFVFQKKSFSFKTSDKSSKDVENADEYEIVSSNKIIFPDLQSKIDEVLDITSTPLLILLDEWQQIPSMLQPYLAEFLKRSFFPLHRVTIIIAALEYRSSFSKKSVQEQAIGFELGADISATIDIDDHYVFDKDRTAIAEVYATVLYRHLSAELGDYLSWEHGVDSPKALRSKLFSSNETFTELARACEGVVRDLINIFAKAALKARKGEIFYR